MILAAHDFGRHIAWSARCVLGVLLSPDARDSKIRDSQVAFTTVRTERMIRNKRNFLVDYGLTIGFNHQIFGLYISVNDILGVKVLKT